MKARKWATYKQKTMWVNTNQRQKVIDLPEGDREELGYPSTFWKGYSGFGSKGITFYKLSVFFLCISVHILVILIL